MSIDWKSAPEASEKYNTTNGLYYRGTRPNLEVWFNEQWECSTLTPANEMFIERPKPEKQWSGPEDGLPPVNSRVEIYDQEYESWVACEVYAHTMFRGEQHASAKTDDEMYYGLPQEFRAIPTPEQIRETAIRELMDIAQVDCRVTAARLVDAGFKREVV